MTPSVRALLGSKQKSFRGAPLLCPRGSNTRGFSNYPILLENIKLSESDISKYYTTESVLSTLTVVNDVTGIQSVSANKAAKSIYNLAGQKMKNTQKGVNIIDGKKVLVK
jgi:hypothetical protein